MRKENNLTLRGCVSFDVSSFYFIDFSKNKIGKLLTKAYGLLLPSSIVLLCLLGVTTPAKAQDPECGKMKQVHIAPSKAFATNYYERMPRGDNINSGSISRLSPYFKLNGVPIPEGIVEFKLWVKHYGYKSGGARCGQAWEVRVFGKDGSRIATLKPGASANYIDWTSPTYQVSDFGNEEQLTGGWVEVWHYHGTGRKCPSGPEALYDLLPDYPRSGSSNSTYYPKATSKGTYAFDDGKIVERGLDKAFNGLYEDFGGAGGPDAFSWIEVDVVFSENEEGCADYDFGDAPVSYGDASHVIDGETRIGASVDEDTGSWGDGSDANNNATDDDVEGDSPDDEDGVVF